MMDRPVAHHPITSLPPKSFSSALAILWGMQNEARLLISTLHFFPHPHGSPTCGTLSIRPTIRI